MSGISGHLYSSGAICYKGLLCMKVRVVERKKEIRFTTQKERAKENILYNIECLVYKNTAVYCMSRK